MDQKDLMNIVALKANNFSKTNLKGRHTNKLYTSFSQTYF